MSAEKRTIEGGLANLMTVLEQREAQVKAAEERYNETKEDLEESIEALSEVYERVQVTMSTEKLNETIRLMRAKIKEQEQTYDFQWSILRVYWFS